MTALFSIITITRNNLAGLQATHESLAAQQLQEFEWLVIDGASEDGSVEYLTTLYDASHSIPPPLREGVRGRVFDADHSTNTQHPHPNPPPAGGGDFVWTSEPDHGIYDAMNKGIARANGMYLLFLNAGDTLAAPETLLDLATYIGERDLLPDFIYGDSYEAAPNAPPNYKPARPYSQRARGMFTHHQAMLYRREALNHPSGDLRYNQDYKIAADYDLTCRFLQQTDSVLYWPQPICIFESGGLSQQNATQGRKEQFKIRKTLGLTPHAINILFYIMQALWWQVRQLLPHLYWRLKSH